MNKRKLLQIGPSTDEGVWMHSLMKIISTPIAYWYLSSIE